MARPTTRSQTGAMDDRGSERAGGICSPAIELAERYTLVQPRLLRYLRSLAPTLAEDLSSQVWVEVVAGIDRFSGDGEAFRRWVFTIGRRRLIDSIRQSGRMPVDVRPPDHPQLLNLPDPVEIEADADARSAARTLLERLPRDQAEVVLLRVVGGFSAEEVGEITGRRAGAVRVIQHRALRRLAHELAMTRRG